MNQFTFLSEIYRLLGEADAESVRQALEQPLSPEVRRIVEAVEAAHNASSTPRSVSSVPHDPAQQGDDSPLAFLRAVSISPAELASGARRAGLRVSARPKDGRDRLVKRIELEFSRLTAGEQARALAALRRHFGVDETAGWMNVIRRSPGDE